MSCAGETALPTGHAQTCLGPGSRIFELQLVHANCKPEDVGEHCKWSDFLLSHYTKTFADRSVYWTARERSKTHQDLLTMAVGSYDKGKVTLPRWPFQRTPKKAIFESTHRNLTAYSIFSRVLDGDIYFHDAL